MLYIDQIDDFSVRFSDEPDGAGNVKIVAIPVESRMEVDERIWMRQSSNIEHLLNNAELEDIVFNGETYLDAESLVVAMNAQLGALLSYLWSFFSESSDGKQVVFEAEEGDVIFEIEMEDR